MDNVWRNDGNVILFLSRKLISRQVAISYVRIVVDAKFVIMVGTYNILMGIASIVPNGIIIVLSVLDRSHNHH